MVTKVMYFRFVWQICVDCVRCERHIRCLRNKCFCGGPILKQGLVFGDTRPFCPAYCFVDIYIQSVRVAVARFDCQASVLCDRLGLFVTALVLCDSLGFVRQAWIVCDSFGFCVALLDCL